MEKKGRYHVLATYLCAAYTAYRARIGLDYALTAYVRNRETLGTFWTDAAQIIDERIRRQQNVDEDKLIDSVLECIDSLKQQSYDLKPLTSMTDNDIEKLVAKLPEGCDVCGNPPSESIIWLLEQLRDWPKGSIQ